MGAPEHDANAVRSLTRKFGSAAELREELDRNLVAGSVWVPLGTIDDRPTTGDAVEVHLVLADGRVVDALKGRVACVGPDGIAVELGILAPEIRAMLSEEASGDPPLEVPSAVVPQGDPAPPAALPPPSEQPTLASAFATPEDPDVTRATPAARSAGNADQTRLSIPMARRVIESWPDEQANAPTAKQPAVPPPAAPADPQPYELDPTEAPPLPFGISPVAAAPIATPSPEPEPELNSGTVPEFSGSDPEIVPPEPAPEAPVASAAPARSWADDIAAPDPDPVPETAAPEPTAEPADFPVARDGATAPAPPHEPVSSDPVESAAGYNSLLASIKPSRPGGRDTEPLTADFPAVRRPADENPVPSLVGSVDAGVWAEPSETDWGIGLPAEKLAGSASLKVSFTDGAALRRAYDVEISNGTLSVPTDARPGIDAQVEIEIGLPIGGAIRLAGVIASHSATGVVVKLEPIDSTTRAVLIAAADSTEPIVTADPTEPITAVTPAPAAAAPAAPQAAKNAQGRFELVLPFASLAEFKKEYETNIRKGGVLVPTKLPPPIRAAVDVVFSLMSGKREVRVRGEVVFHAAGGAGVQLAEIPQGVKQDIDALLAAASVVAPPTPPPQRAAPAVIVSAPPPPPAIDPEPEPLVAPVPPPETAPAPVRGAPLPAGERFEGDLVEVLREAEVEGEARIEGQVGGRASWLKVLATLQSQRATGVLTASRKGETKTFLLYQGRVVDGMGTPQRHDESIFAIARKLTLLKPGPLRILEKALDGSRDEYEAASSAGVWSTQELDKARRFQLLDRCADVFGWEKGRYRFDPTGDRGWARPTSGVAMGHIILHGVRSFIRASGEDLARVMRPALDRVLAVVPQTGFEPGRVGMSDKELRFWTDIDGVRTMRSLLQTTPIPVSQSYRIVFALCRLGVLAFSGHAAAKAKENPLDTLRARLADVKSRDPFGKLGLSWMASGQQIQSAWDSIRTELAGLMRAGGEAASLAKEIFEACEGGYKQVSEERNRRLVRLKLIEDPSRIEASAEMLAEKADILHLRGDRAGAIATIQMALDLSPGNEQFRKLSNQFTQQK